MKDIDDIIHRKIFAVEQILSQMKEIVKKSKSLSPSEIKEISITISDWSEDAVRKHIENLKELVVNPIRHKNKKKLENIGVNIEKISVNIFEDTELIDKIVLFSEKLKNIDDQLIDILLKEHLIERWVRDTPDKIELQLQEIVEAESSIKEIFQKNFDEKFKYELLKRILEDADFLNKAEEIISNIEYLNSFGVLLDPLDQFEEFCNISDYLSSKIKENIENNEISKEEVKQKIKGKTLSKASEIIKKIETECIEKKRKLLEEWKMYSSTLRSFDDEIQEPPDTLLELKKSVSLIRDKCLKHMGTPGFKLLKFLKGEEDFPDDIKLEEIKKALEALRPIFLKSLKEES